ncbi:MAG: reverse transcriptase domain-containing protein [Myxococcaceae bacterium]
MKSSTPFNPDELDDLPYYGEGAATERAIREVLQRLPDDVALFAVGHLAAERILPGRLVADGQMDGGAGGSVVAVDTDIRRIWTGHKLPSVGLAQGGALSGVLANLVLDSVDRAVLQPDGGDAPDLFYGRYVDDLIIVHRSRRECEAAFARCLAACERLHLPVHPPLKVRRYHPKPRRNRGMLFWEAKSRAPYRWEEKGTRRASVPWVGLLGYQIRFDGLLRIRPSSLANHLRSQRVEANNVIGAVLRRTVTAMEFPALAFWSYVRRMQALSRPRLVRGELQRGWSAGFRLLRGNRHLESQLRTLDRGLGRQVARLRLRLEMMTRLPAPKSLLRGIRRYSKSYVAQMEKPNGPPPDRPEPPYL